MLMKSKCRVLFGALTSAMLLLLLVSAPVAAEEVVENYPDGAVKAKYALSQGEKSGNYLEFYEDGTNKVRARYKSGALDGPYQEFWPNGKTKTRTAYRNGELNGRFEEFNEDNRILLRANYTDGKLDGTYQTFEPGERTPSLEQEWSNGILTHPRSKAAIAEEFKWIASYVPEEMEGHSPEDHSADRLASLRRLMGYRMLVGVPYKEMLLSPDLNEKSTLGAELNSIHGSLTHTPKNPGWEEAKYKKGYAGAKNANIAYNILWAAAVDAWMYDSDSSNIAALGHRRWNINPALRTVGFGASGKYCSLSCHDTSGEGLVQDWTFIAFPAPGYMPLDYMNYKMPGKGHGDYAWNVTVNLKKYEKPGDGVKVTVYDPNDRKNQKENDGKGVALENDYFKINNQGYGLGGCIIFRPKDITRRDGAKFWVEITGLQPKGDAPSTILYLVEFAGIR